MLVRLKDQDTKEKKNGVIYSHQCGAIDCGEGYTSETSRTLEERYKNHLLIQANSQSTGCQLSQDNFNIIDREVQDLARLIKESIYIRVNNPTLNRNIGTFQLNHNWDRINHNWDRVLFSTPNIKVAISTGNLQHSP